jgi:RNase H-like domain found in reverse transcriptase
LTQIDKDGKFYAIAYARRKLQKYEMNYTPFLLEMQAAIFGMETFEVHLKGRHFKLFTDHKPLEKLGKVHTKTLNRLQQMNLFSFEVIYKKGGEMPADFLSRNAVDAINFDLSTYAREQNKDDILRSL